MVPQIVKLFVGVTLILACTFSLRGGPSGVSASLPLSRNQRFNRQSLSQLAYPESSNTAQDAFVAQVSTLCLVLLQISNRPAFTRYGISVHGILSILCMKKKSFWKCKNEPTYSRGSPLGFFGRERLLWENFNFTNRFSLWFLIGAS